MQNNSPLVYQDQAGMFDARPTMVQSPKVQIPERNFCFSSILVTPLESWCFEHVAEF